MATVADGVGSATPRARGVATPALAAAGSPPTTLLSGLIVPLIQGHITAKNETAKRIEQQREAAYVDAVVHAQSIGAGRYLRCRAHRDRRRSGPADRLATKRHDAQVAELTGLLRQSASGDRLDAWPADIRILVQREKIEHRTQLLLFEQINGYRY